MTLGETGKKEMAIMIANGYCPLPTGFQPGITYGFPPSDTCV